MSDHFIYLAELITDAVKECNPYDFDSDEAFDETMDSLIAEDVESSIAFFHEFVDELSEVDRVRLYPSTMAVLPMLETLKH